MQQFKFDSKQTFNFITSTHLTSEITWRFTVKGLFVFKSIAEIIDGNKPFSFPSSSTAQILILKFLLLSVILNTKTASFPLVLKTGPNSKDAT